MKLKNQESMPILKCQECGKYLQFCEECQVYHCNNVDCKRYDRETEEYHGI